MKSLFGALFVISIFFAIANPAELTWWQRALPVLLVLALQTVFVGKGLNRVSHLQAELSSAKPDRPGLKGLCRWEKFEDDTWTITVHLSDLPQSLAYADGVTKLGAGIELNVKGKRVQPRWVREKNLSPQMKEVLYNMAATLRDSEEIPSIFHQLEDGEVVTVCHNAEPILEGALTTT